MSSVMLGHDGAMAFNTGKTYDNDNVSALYFDKNATFSKMGLDRRIFKAVAKAAYIYPSLVQTKTIPYLLEGRDVLVRARTGSGKTAAYVLPILHKVLGHIQAIQDGTVDDSDGPNNSVQAVILVPTRDLVDQVANTIVQFSYYCKDVIRTVTLNGDVDSKKAMKLELAQLKLSPHIVVATPTRLLQHCEAGNINLKKSLKHLVLDEADLVLSYGYESDVKTLNTYFPEYYNTVLMSATLTPELDALRGVLLHDPAIVKLEDGKTNSQLKQYYMTVPEHEKHLMLFSQMTLGVYKGKTLIFVNSIQTAFNLKLFFEHFGVISAVLNDDLPYNSRRNIVMQFNRGVFNYLIATDLSNDEIDIDDEMDLDEQVKLQVFDEALYKQGDNETDEDFLSRIEKLNGDKKQEKEKEKRKTKKNKNVGSVRGIDFTDVQTVVNFDFPTTYKAYTHRVGRTARAGKVGQAISFVSSKEEGYFDQVLEHQSIAEGKDIIASKDIAIKPLPFNVQAAEAFRVRVSDNKRKISPKRIKEARLTALRAELLNSTKLKAHFEDNPTEFQLLKHTRNLGMKKQHIENNFVPSYLISDEYKACGITGGHLVVGGDNALLQLSKTKLKSLSRKRKLNSDPIMALEAKSKRARMNAKEKEKKKRAKSKKDDKKKSKK